MCWSGINLVVEKGYQTLRIRQRSIYHKHVRVPETAVPRKDSRSLHPKAVVGGPLFDGADPFGPASCNNCARLRTSSFRRCYSFGRRSRTNSFGRCSGEVKTIAEASPSDSREWPGHTGEQHISQAMHEPIVDEQIFHQSVERTSFDEGANE